MLSNSTHAFMKRLSIPALVITVVVIRGEGREERIGEINDVGENDKKIPSFRGL